MSNKIELILLGFQASAIGEVIMPREVTVSSVRVQNVIQFYST